MQNKTVSLTPEHPKQVDGDGEVLAAQEKVLELARSIYLLLAGVDAGIAEGALEVARVFKSRENTISRRKTSAQLLQSRGF